MAPAHTGTLTDTDERHGTYAGWLAHLTEYSHPCEDCMRAAVAKRKTTNARKREKPLTETDPRHGTYEGYLAHRGERKRLCAGCSAAAEEVAEMLRELRAV